jgi:hypothetical protein
MAPEVLARVVRTESLASGGKSGSTLARGWLDDGSTVVIKYVDPQLDWIMQATRDDGRVAALWADGVFDRLPGNVQHATLEVTRDRGGAVVVMRDVSAQLFDDHPPTRAQRSVVLAAVTTMHVALAGQDIAPLCRLTDYLTFLSPSVCARFAADHVVPQLALDGWGRSSNWSTPTYPRSSTTCTPIRDGWPRPCSNDRRPSSMAISSSPTSEPTARNPSCSTGDR